MLNMSIILFRYKQFTSKIYNAISRYYFLCKLITDLHNSIHFIHWTRSYGQKFGSAKKIGGSVRFGLGKNSWFGRFLVGIIVLVLTMLFLLAYGTVSKISYWNFLAFNPGEKNMLQFQVLKYTIRYLLVFMKLYKT